VGYGIVGMWQLLLAACFALTHKQWRAASTPAETSAPPRVGAASSGCTLQQPIVWLSMAVFFLYTGLEAAAGVWPYSLFIEGRGIPPSTAGMWVSAYWAG
jgi:fucose permease